MEHLDKVSPRIENRASSTLLQFPASKGETGTVWPASGMQLLNTGAKNGSRCLELPRAKVLERWHVCRGHSGLEAVQVQFTPDSQALPSVLGSKGWRCLP